MLVVCLVGYAQPPLLPGQEELSLLDFGADYPESFFQFGHPRAEGSFKAFVLRDAGSTDDYEVWATNRWSHMCLSYRKSDGFIRVVKVLTRRDS